MARNEVFVDSWGAELVGRLGIHAQEFDLEALSLFGGCGHTSAVLLGEYLAPGARGR